MDLIGKYVIARCHDAGVHAGTLVSTTGREAVLANSRRLYQWQAAKGITLSAVAVYGIDASRSTLPTELPAILLADVCELIPCLDRARESIQDAPEAAAQ